MTRAETPYAPHALIGILLVALLLAIRLPSLVEPAGADQGLYAYVGQRINLGDVAYRDAWDQKPPAVHFIYSALWRAWPHESVVAAADLIAAGAVAWLLIVLGRRTFGSQVGVAAACVFLLLGNPALQRLGGVRVRAQCETFIALAVTAALVLAAGRGRRAIHWLAAGSLAALAFWLKYNAGIYVIPILAMGMIAGTPDLKVRGSMYKPIPWIAGGFAAVSAIFLSYFAAHGALHDLRLATVDYNLQYSAETYAEGFRSVVDYVMFPIQRAKLELIWYLGGLGTLALILCRRREASTWIAVAWMAAACVSIAVNGARNLPQYFLQAHPALALAAAAGLWPLVRRPTGTIVRAAVAIVLMAGLWRVGDEPAAIRFGGLPEIVRNAAFDLQYARGRVARRAFLSRFQQQSDAKYVPVSAEDLTAHVRRTTGPGDRIFVFGLAANVYVNAERQSASRFFWSWPVMVEFGRGRPGYGSAGLLEDLQQSSPALVALQKHWGDPGPLRFFMNNAGLRSWLMTGYVLDQEIGDFVVWRRRS